MNIAANLRPVCALVLVGGALLAPAQRIHERFDADWKFKLDASTLEVTNEIPEWHWWTPAERPDPDASTPPLIRNQISVTAHAGDDVFKGRVGFAWFETTVIKHIPPNQLSRTVLHFDSVDDNATVYLNGRRILHHEGWNDPFDVPLTGWNDDGPNRITVLVENTAGPGGIGAVRFTMLDRPIASPAEAKPGFKDSGWRTVHLPHDFVIEGTFAERFDAGHGALARGTAWYRKSFSLPKSAMGKSIWIDFDGAFSDAHVWFNGVYLGSHRSGYTGFRFDLQKYARFGAHNTLAVHLDARKTEGWWYEGGGLYRHVWLTIANPVHVSPMGGVFVTTSVVDVLRKPRATIRAQVTVDNSGLKAVAAQIRNTVLNPGGKVIAVKTTKWRLAGKQTGVVLPMLSEPHAKLWSLTHPQLYTLRTEVLLGGKRVDEVETRFGIRTIRFDAAKGFLLNERRVKLKGTCNHQDFAGVGIGMPDSVLAWRIAKLKGMGSNAYRCSHNEVASELLDACDRLGMLVMDENRELGDTYSGKASPSTTTNDLSDLRQEVLRDRNHPSVIMWSIGNEEWAVQTNPAGERIGTAMVSAVHALDPTRPVTAALNGGHGSYLSRTLDLEGFNYDPAGYAAYHASHPNHPMFASETASTTTTRGIYAVDKVRGYVPAYDLNDGNSAEADWEPIAREPYNAGGFVWTGFDYKGEPTPYGWPCVNSHFGILDLAGFPKDLYYYYKAWWGGAPTVHVFPHWNWPGKEGQPINVWVFSNGDSVELFLNGKSLGRKANPPYEHLAWLVPYAPGKLVARAYAHGKLIATDSVATTGAPAALKVVTSRTQLVGDNEDTTMLEVAVVDAHGRVVPTAGNLVSFTVSGPARVSGVGNGDPSCHEPDRSSKRHAFNGHCLGLIQAKGRSGRVVVRVSSPGLKSAILTLSVATGQG
ncbi:MAG: beta-galactosidase GalA [Fimbriimonadaceae bacterium]